MTTQAITKPEENPLALPAENSPVALIQQAIQTGIPAESLRELLAVRREWEADEARKAYFLAVSQFQQRAPIIEKGDDAHGKKYARMDRIWREIRPLVAELGLAVTWQKCEITEHGLHVEGKLSHALGHSETIVADTALPELIRGQNQAQQVGSAETYAKRRALCSALGIVTGDDDDGHAAGAPEPVTAEQAEELDTLLGDMEALEKGSAARFLKACQVEKIEDLPADRYELAKNKIVGHIRKLEE